MMVSTHRLSGVATGVCVATLLSLEMKAASYLVISEVFEMPTKANLNKVKKTELLWKNFKYEYSQEVLNEVTQGFRRLFSRCRIRNNCF